jgi:hypothetical protein
VTAMPKIEDWVSAEEAAEMLGVNVRQVQKRAKAGYLAKTYLPRLPNERQGRVRYARADVTALLAGTPNHCEGVTAKKAGTEFPGPTGDGAADLERIRTHLQLAALPDPELEFRKHVMELIAAEKLERRARSEPRAWLTLTEAAEYCGLEEQTLVNICKASNVRAIDASGLDVGMETRKSSAWRVQRASLDAWGARP